ncbi:hypothetical protein [Imbroritus primus]|uniref:hypothetical protein n=1 Tax=Imbroritus primus TaxID=3058603 RepID=UPI000269694D
MGGFCVFGVSKTACKDRARRNTKTYSPTLKRELTIREFENLVSEKADALFAGDAKPKQISPEFDAPQFCREWIEVALRDGSIRSASVMARKQKVDGNGKPVHGRAGRPLFVWAPY